jgi:AraC-like DNA-binding protein
MRNLHGLVLKKHSPVGQIVRSHIRALVAAAGALEESDIEAMGRGSAAFLAQALAGATYRAPRDQRAFTDVTLLRVRQFIEDRLGQPGLSPDHIARACAVSRATLYRLFEPLGGVAAYVRRQRLLRAKRDLASIALDGQTISAIARRNGFIDDASFRRAFRQAFGVSASDVRSHRTNACASVLADGKIISDWVRDL